MKQPDIETLIPSMTPTHGLGTGSERLWFGPLHYGFEPVTQDARDLHKRLLELIDSNTTQDEKDLMQKFRFKAFVYAPCDRPTPDTPDGWDVRVRDLCEARARELYPNHDVVDSWVAMLHTNTGCSVLIRIKKDEKEA